MLLVKETSKQQKAYQKSYHKKEKKKTSIEKEKIPLRELQAGEVTSSGRALFHLRQGGASMKNYEVDKPGVEDNSVRDQGLESVGCRYFWL